MNHLRINLVILITAVVVFCSTTVVAQKAVRLLPKSAGVAEIGRQIDKSQQHVTLSGVVNEKTAAEVISVRGKFGDPVLAKGTPAKQPAPRVTSGTVRNVPGSYGTIQAAINAANSGDIINVYPGTYALDEANGFDPRTGGAGWNDFNIIVYKSLTIQGVTAGGVPITDYHNVEAFITAKRDLPTFGCDAIFVQADGVTITGLSIQGFDSPAYNNKSIEVAGDNFTLKYCKVDGLDGAAAVYMDDYHFNAGANVSHIQSYRIEANYLNAGIDATCLYIASGAGWSGPVSGRVVTGNTLTNADDAIAFVGPGYLSWDLYPVGAATITNNTFSNVARRHVLAYGGTLGNPAYENLDWAGIVANNAFDKAAITWTPGGDARGWDLPASNFFNAKGIYATVQRYAINKAQSGDNIQLLGGTYVENLTIPTSLTLYGAGQGNTTVYPATSGPNPPNIGSLGAGASNIVLVQASNVTIHDLTLDGDNPNLTTGIVAGGADLDARNGIITDHTLGPVFNNLEVYNTTVKNIYLRGVYASTGGTFNLHHNTVQNVQPNYASIAIFNFGGSGTIANNTVSGANDAISANHSRGTQFLNNNITGIAGGSAMHTDNAGDGGGTADVIEGNMIAGGGWGIFIFVPYVAPTVQGNSVMNTDVALSAIGGDYAPSPTVTTIFNRNTVDGQSKANSVGFFVTNSTIGYGLTSVNANLTNSFISNNTYAFDLESALGYTVTVNANGNSIDGNANQVYTDMVPAAGWGGNGAVGTMVADLRGNWWGGSSAPVVTGLSLSSVLFSPFYGVGTDASPATTGFQPVSPMTWSKGPLSTIQSTIDFIPVGDIARLSAGMFNESVSINKGITLIGAGMDQTYIIGPKTSGYSVSLTAANATLDGLTIKRDGNSLADWAGNANTTGLSCTGVLTGSTVQNCKVTENRNGVYLNNAQGLTVRNNVFTFNRTGVQLVNNVSNCLIENNTITNNWTVGFVVYYASNPMAATTNFIARNNDISENWYSQIDSKTSQPNSSTSYDFRNNWWGSATLNVTNSPAGEPGYAAQIPAAYGGSAVSPGTNNGKISGDLVALINHDPWTGKAVGIVVTPAVINTPISFPNTDVTMNFGSLPPGTNSTVSVQQTPTADPSLPAPPVAGAVAPLYLKLTAPGLTNYTFQVTVTIDVSGIAGFGPTTEVMYFSSASNSWVGINGTYNAGPPATYTFTTDHFTPFAFVNPTNPLNLYLLSDASNTSSNVLTLKGGIGTGSHFGTDDWSYAGVNETLYVVPAGAQPIVAASFKVKWDATKATAVASVGNLFANGSVFNTTPGAGEVLINTANLSPTINVAPVSGGYLARIIFTVTTPGYNSLTTDNIDFRYYDETLDTQGSVYVTNNLASIKFYLGDFANAMDVNHGDGLINFSDLSPFSSAYWSQSNGTPAGYKAKFDIGPTNANGGYFGLPTPDGKVEFEDLVIFAIGYGKSSAGQLLKQQVAKPVTLALNTVQKVGDVVRVPISISGSVSDLRAISLVLKASGMTFTGVEKAGEMNHDYAFMISKAEGGKVMIDAAIIGSEHDGLSQNGTIAYALFTGKGSVSIEKAIARTTANGAIEVLYSKGMLATDAIPVQYTLEQNYPNPFNPTTTIRYALPNEGAVKISVYNLLGEVVATLVDGVQQSGFYEVVWNGTNNNHQSVATGVYLYKITAGDFVSIKKMALMK